MKSKSEIQEEIVNQLPSPVHGLLKLPMRAGKTKIGIDIIKRDKPKSILWVTVSETLRDVDIPKEFEEWKAKRFLKKTKIICWQSLSRIKGHYDTIILDEFQKITPSNVKNILNDSLTYENIIGLSGTMPKHEEKLELYKTLKLNVLVSMTIDEAVKLGLIAPYKIKVIETRLDSKTKNIKAGSKTKPFMTTEFSNYQYKSGLIRKMQFSGRSVPAFMFIDRARYIANLPSKNAFAQKFVNNLSGRTLVFTGSQAEANKYPYVFHSKTNDKDLVKFQNNEIDTLACVNSGGIGFTFRNVDNFVIVQVNSNKSGDVTQKIGRALVPQEGYLAKIYIIVVRDTVDEKWKDKVLEDFDFSRVEHVSCLNYGG